MYSPTITYHTANAAYWTGVAADSATTFVDAGAAQIGVSFCTVAWTRTVPTGLREDKATCTFAFAKDPGGKLWSYLIDADKATVEGILDTWWTGYKTDVANQWSLNEYRWHDWHVTDSALGPADRVTARAVAATGNAAGRMPDQDACTYTFQTASRRHWGRVFLPGVCTTQMDLTYGRLPSAVVDTALGYWHTATASLHTASLDQVIASRKHAGILEITKMSMDDILDIQRRRRAKQAAYHKTFTS